MADFFDFRALSQAQCETLEASLDSESVRGLLCEYLGLDSLVGTEDPRKTKIALDLFFYCYAYCKERALSKRQTCCLLSIMRHVFAVDMAPPAAAKTMAQSYEAFAAILLRHSVDRPPVSIKVFEADQAAHALEYAVNSYYRHFRLYKYVFSVKVVLRIAQVLPQEVEVCRPSLPPLDSSLHYG